MLLIEKCAGCGERLDEVIVESFELTGELLCRMCAESDFEERTADDPPCCRRCHIVCHKPYEWAETFLGDYLCEACGSEVRKANVL